MEIDGSSNEDMVILFRRYLSPIYSRGELAALRTSNKRERECGRKKEKLREHVGTVKGEGKMN